MTVFAVRHATQKEIKILHGLFNRLGKEDSGYFESCFEKNCIIIIASQQINNKVEDIGFCILNFEPKYQLYKKLDIPEVKELNVWGPCYLRHVSILQMIMDVRKSGFLSVYRRSMDRRKGYTSARGIFQMVVELRMTANI